MKENEGTIVSDQENSTYWAVRNCEQLRLLPILASPYKDWLMLEITLWKTANHWNFNLMFTELESLFCKLYSVDELIRINR